MFEPSAWVLRKRSAAKAVVTATRYSRSNIVNRAVTLLHEVGENLSRVVGIVAVVQAEEEWRAATASFAIWFGRQALLGRRNINMA